MKLTNEKLLVEMCDFGQKVGVLRQELGLDKRAFAEKCGISYKHYFNIERGIALPSLPAYISICRGLKLRVPLI